MKKMILALGISVSVIGSAAFAHVVTPPVVPLPPVVEEDDDDVVVGVLPSAGLGPVGIGGTVFTVGLLAIILTEEAASATTTVSGGYGSSISN